MLKKNEIAIFNTNDFNKCVSIIEEYWNQHYGTFDIEGKNGRVMLELTTGGWSENEEIIDEILNSWFWNLWWQESKRGGYYKFMYVEKMSFAEEIKENKQENKNMGIIGETFEECARNCAVNNSKQKVEKNVQTHNVTISTEKLKQLIKENYKYNDYTLQGKIEIVTKLAYFENDKDILEFLIYMEE